MAGQAIVLVTVLVTLSQTGDAATQAPRVRVESGPHISRLAAGAACVIFNDQAEFEAFNTAQGRVLKGIETFEESTIFTAVDAMDDPLCGGIPNSPDGFPFPNGLDEENLCVQSNRGHHPEAPNPRGIDGLAAVGAGFLGLLSDIVLANKSADSLDLMFGDPVPPEQQDSHTAIGFNPIRLLGGDVVKIRVYDKNNVLLSAGISPVDMQGQHFWGVSCPQAIGRINIWDPADGHEGGDSIQMWTGDEVPCGNGNCEPDLGEQCLSCPPDCGPCVCGNGEVEPGEECDPPGQACPAENHVCRDDCTCGPVNDACADTRPIFDGATDFSTEAATTDGLAHESCQYDGQTYHDIWYSYIATCSGDLFVSMCNSVSYDSDLVVYGGCHPGDWTCPPGDAEMLGCNDDDPGCAGFSSSLWLQQILEGNCYTIRIGGWRDGDMGTGFVNVHCETVFFCGDGICQPREGEALCNCPQDCPGECPCVQFDNRLEFEAFNEDQGQILKGIEDFEESTLPLSAVVLLDDPLCGGIPNVDPATGWGFPDGLSESNLCVQSNIDGESAPAPNPRGVEGLLTASEAVGLGPCSDIVVGNFFVDSLDLIFDPGDNPTGVGFNTLALLGGDRVQISVFDENDIILLTASSPADICAPNFWGVWCVSAIRRINIFDTGNGVEGGDNIQMWVNAPDCGTCPTDVDGSGDTGPADLAVLLGSWGPCAPGHECACLDADDDGTIGAADLAALLGAWGPCL